MGEANRRGSREKRASMARQREAADINLRAEASEFLTKGLSFEADVLKEAQQIREQAKSDYCVEWLDARLILLSIAQHLLSAKSLVPGHTSEEISHLLVLLMAFFQGTHITEMSISEGQYIKAAAALKQDYEIIARILEVRAGTAKPGQTPQVRYLAQEVRGYYGELNKIAHPSNQEILVGLMRSLASGESQAVSHLPVYNKESSQGLYELHVWLILMAVQQYLLLFIKMYSQEEPELQEAGRWFAGAVDMLAKVGFKFD
jgi:hypothetical protein